MENETLAAALSRASRTVAAMRGRALAPHGLTPDAFAALEGVSREPGIAMGSLARSCLLNLPALSKLTDRLAARDLVRRERDGADSRRVRLHLTPEGAVLVAAARKAAAQVDAELAGRAGQWDTDRLKRLLAALG